MRILLSAESRKRLFEFLKLKHKAKTFQELSLEMKLPYKTLQKWRIGERLIPEKVVEQSLQLEVIQRREDSWGASKGGKIGGVRSVLIQRKRLGKKKFMEKMKKMRDDSKATSLWDRFSKDELIKLALKGKLRRRTNQILLLESQHKNYFTSKKICFNNKTVRFSKYDKRKNIILPTELTPDLAEEIGMHLGDGCLSSKNYFSIKCDLKGEESYIRNFVIPLYKRLFNLDLKLVKYSSVCGFEVYSQALHQFKSKVLKIPIGEKVESIKIPKCIVDSKDKEIYKACIRGLFDTDGCFYISNRKYPVVTLTIKSKVLISQVSRMLKTLGYIPSVHKWTINLNGKVMLDKWIHEIGSNNPKNLARIQLIKNNLGE